MLKEIAHSTGTLEKKEIPVGGEELWVIKKGKKKTRELLGVLLDGEKSPSLSSSIVTYRLTSGDVVTAACHTAEGRHSKNADRIAINVHGSAVTGIDGFKSAGDQVATILGKEMLFDGPAAAAKNTYTAIEKMDKASGAVFAQAQIVEKDGEKFLIPSQIGDTRIVVLDEKDNLVWESTDEDLVTKMVEQGSVQPDAALYHPLRSTVTNYVGHGLVPSVTRHAPIPLKPGYKVIVASDGVFDNLTTEEFILRIKGKDATEIIKTIEEVVLPRMQNAENIISATKNRAAAGVFSDGLRSAPKPDNCGIAVTEITAVSKHMANLHGFLNEASKEADTKKLGNLLAQATLALHFLTEAFSESQEAEAFIVHIDALEYILKMAKAMDDMFAEAQAKQTTDRGAVLFNASRIRAHCLSLKEQGMRHPILTQRKLDLQSLQESIRPDECFSYMRERLGFLDVRLLTESNGVPAKEMTSRSKEIVRLYDLWKAIAPRDTRLFDVRDEVEILRTYLKFIDTQRLARSGEEELLRHAGNSARRQNRELKKNPEVRAVENTPDELPMPLVEFAQRIQQHMQRFIEHTNEDLERMEQARQ